MTEPATSICDPNPNPLGPTGSDEYGTVDAAGPSAGRAAMINAPLWMTPPSTPEIQAHIRSGRFGAIMTPAAGNRFDPAYQKFCVDNSVFGGKYPGDKKFLTYLERFQPYAHNCLFVTAPDSVGNHWETVNLSWHMLPRIREMGFPAGFVAQDYMEYSASADLLEAFDVLFIGGTTDWKEGPEARNLAAVAGGYGKKVHMGRVNSEKRFRYAASIGCDSVDGTYLTYGPNVNLPNVLKWTREPTVSLRRRPTRRRAETPGQHHLPGVEFDIEFNECGNLVSHTAEFGDIEHPEYVRRFWVQLQAIGPGLWAYSAGTEPVVDDFGYPEDGRVWAFGMDCRSDADATSEQVAQDIVRGLE